MARRRTKTQRVATRRIAARRRKAKNPSSAGDLVKYGLIAAAAYYVYTQWSVWFPATTTTTTTLPAGTTTTTSSVPSPVVQPSAPVASLVVTTSPGGVVLPAPFQTTAGGVVADANWSKGYAPTSLQMLQYAAGSGGWDADQWLFYYNQLSGDSVTYEQLNIPSGQDRSTVLSVQGFSNVLPTANALSGLRGLGSFGFPSQYTQMANQWKTNWN